MKYKAKHNANGFAFRFRRISLIFIQNDGVGWIHLMERFEHPVHAFDTQLNACSSLNSLWMSSSSTHPRSHFNECLASFGRLFESNQCGDSGTWDVTKIKTWETNISKKESKFETHKVNRDYTTNGKKGTDERDLSPR